MNYHIVRYSTPFLLGSKAAHHSLALLLSLLLLVESVARASAPSPRLFAQGGAGPNPIVQEGKDVRPLEPWKPIERELAGGQSHSYQITLTIYDYALTLKGLTQQGAACPLTTPFPHDPKVTAHRL